MTAVNESIVEEAALDWFRDLGYAVAHGPALAPGEPGSERDSFGDVLLVGRLREALCRLNPTLPPDAHDEALRKVLRIGTPSLIQTNRTFHGWLRDGVPVAYARADGSIANDHASLVDYTDPQANDWLAVNQFTVIEGQANRRPDMGDAKLRVIASELVTQVRKCVTIDWTLREGARAKIRVMVKRILNKYGYPPDLQEEAVKTVLAQAELLCAQWV